MVMVHFIILPGSIPDVDIWLSGKSVSNIPVLPHGYVLPLEPGEVRTKY